MLQGGEMLMDALDLVEQELAEMEEAQERARGKGAKAAVATRRANPVLLGLSPHHYMIRALRQVLRM